MILDLLAQKYCLKHMLTLKKNAGHFKGYKRGKNIILKGMSRNLTVLGNLTLAGIITKKRNQRM